PALPQPTGARLVGRGALPRPDAGPWHGVPAAVRRRFLRYQGVAGRRWPAGRPGDRRRRRGTVMKVLVSGDRGYIGAVLVPLFGKAGHEVVGLDIGWYDGCDFGPYTLDYESRTGDIRDQRPEDLAGFDAVINLAAISNDPVGHLN